MIKRKLKFIDGQKEEYFAYLPIVFYGYMKERDLKVLREVKGGFEIR